MVPLSASSQHVLSHTNNDNELDDWRPEGVLLSVGVWFLYLSPYKSLGVWCERRKIRQLQRRRQQKFCMSLLTKKAQKKDNNNKDEDSSPPRPQKQNYDNDKDSSSPHQQKHRRRTARTTTTKILCLLDIIYGQRRKTTF